MNKRFCHRLSKTVIAIAFLGMQGAVLAGRVDSPTDSAERAHVLDKRLAAKDREQVQARCVQNNGTSDSGVRGSRDTQLDDYLVMHGRVVDGSIRSTMMPWSALQQVAN